MITILTTLFIICGCSMFYYIYKQNWIKVIIAFLLVLFIKAGMTDVKTDYCKQHLVYTSSEVCELYTENSNNIIGWGAIVSSILYIWYKRKDEE